MPRPGVPDRLRTGWAVAALLAGACATEPPPAPPQMSGATVAPLPSNVLGAVARVTVTGADSVRARFRREGEAVDEVTPAVPAVAATEGILLLGLHSEAAYAVRVEAFGPGGRAEGAALPRVTGALPAVLPVIRTVGTDPSPGYVAFASGMYGLVIDNGGRIVWYHRFPNGPGLNFMPLPNGRWAARPAPAVSGQAPRWVQVDPDGRVLDAVGCADGFIARPHDLVREADGSWWLLCDEVRTLDLSPHGGRPDARVTGTAIQHIGADGTVRFRGSAFDHLDITELPAAQRNGETVNWTHGNALTRDGGGILVSFRNLDQVVRIDTGTGQVTWRLGGTGNSFMIEGVEGRPFAGQHGVRIDAAGRLLLFDNVGKAGDSRVERYVLDPARGVARLEASWGLAPSVEGTLAGSVQELPGGRVLAAFGSGGRVVEFGPDGQPAWWIEGSLGFVFRAQRVLSLYAPGVGLAR